MKRDILDELRRKLISPKEAQSLFDAVLDSGEMGLGEGVGMSKAEYTADCQGVSLEELAAWRKNGWPNKCPLCGKLIDVPKFGWLSKEVGDKHVLEHITCPAKRRGGSCSRTHLR